MKNLNCSFQQVHIVCAAVATQHARCHKEYYSPRGQAVSTSHFCVRAQRFFALAKRFCKFEGPKSPGNITFLRFSIIFKFPPPPRETLNRFKIFSQPMDRTEVLHTPSYDIREGWKNTPDQNDQVLSSEKSTFPKIVPT